MNKRFTFDRTERRNRGGEPSTIERDTTLAWLCIKALVALSLRPTYLPGVLGTHVHQGVYTSLPIIRASIKCTLYGLLLLALRLYRESVSFSAEIARKSKRERERECLTHMHIELFSFWRHFHDSGLILFRFGHRENIIQKEYDDPTRMLR